MKRKFLYIIVSIAVLAFAIRLLVGWEIFLKDPFAAKPSNATDMWTYQHYARQILEGKYSGLFYYQPFYYAIFLPAIFFFTGASNWGVFATQAILGGATVYLASLISARLFGKKAAIATAVLLAFCNTLIVYVPYMLIATLQAFWITLIFYLYLKTVREKKLRWWMVLGITTGCSILTRGNSWFFVPGLLFSALWIEFFATREKAFWKKILPAILFLFFVILPQAPFAWHNSKTLGKFSGPSTAAQSVLSLGNTPEAPPGGRNPGIGPGPMEYPPTRNIWADKINEISIFQRVWEWFKEEPLAFIELTFRKSLLFWDSREIPNNIDIAYNGKKSSSLQIIGLIPASIIIALAISGMLLLSPGLRRNKKQAMLYYFIVAYWMATAAFYILSRFRAPLIPLLGIMAGAYLERCVYLSQKKKQRLLKFALPCLLVGFFICYASYDVYRFGYESAIMRIVRPNGVIVEVSPTETMALDNGPETFGGWSYVKFEPYKVLEKKFSGLGE
jgi:4-amino-4-deoxy-L-arabinose transferase-like glycosyltransferase